MANSISLTGTEYKFLEINEIIEEKVKSLMTEMDSIISNQEDVILKPKTWGYLSSKKEKIGIREHDNIMSRSEDEQSNSNNENRNIDNYNEKTTYEWDCDHNEKRFAANKTIIRFLKAQVVKLQSDIKVIKYELKKKNEQCKELEIKIKKYEGQRENIYHQLSSYKEIIAKAQVSNTELQSKVHLQNVEIMSLKKEIEDLRRDLKSVNQLSSNCDVRLGRSLEENEKLRSMLKISQSEGKELREQVRKIQDEKRLALKNMDKKCSEIFQAFGKQTQLVDNLKKQKTHLEASKEIRLIEEDFVKLLNWKPHT